MAGQGEIATAPPVVAEEGWEPVQPLRIEGGRGSFVSGDPRGDTLRLAYFRRAARPGEGNDRLVGRAWFGPGSQGPPGHAHGGAMAAVLDECMGAAAWMTGLAVVAAHIEVDFENMLPLGTDAWFEAWVESVDGRKVDCRARVYARGEDGTEHPLARSTGLFLTLPMERFRELLDQVARSMETTPEELRREMKRRGWKGE
ncbi:MAG TPA: PaaI family thioesterase [Thermoanaerobaculia bacterium]|nr:PaaI family thioesterase [Thermoanaerobaculia bacterium]